MSLPICSLCGEKEVAPGEELCFACLGKRMPQMPRREPGERVVRLFACPCCGNYVPRQKRDTRDSGFYCTRCNKYSVRRFSYPKHCNCVHRRAEEKYEKERKAILARKAKERAKAQAEAAKVKARTEREERLKEKLLAAYRAKQKRQRAKAAKEK